MIRDDSIRVIDFRENTRFSIIVRDLFWSMIFRKNVDFGVLNSVAEEIFVAIVGFLKFDFMMKIWYYRFWQFDFEFIDDQIFEIFL